MLEIFFFKKTFLFVQQEFHIASWVGRTTALSYADWAGVYVSVTFAMGIFAVLSSGGLVFTTLRAALLIHNLVLRRVLDGNQSLDSND